MDIEIVVYLPLPLPLISAAPYLATVGPATCSSSYHCKAGSPSPDNCKASSSFFNWHCLCIGIEVFLHAHYLAWWWDSGKWTEVQQLYYHIVEAMDDLTENGSLKHAREHMPSEQKAWDQAEGALRKCRTSWEVQNQFEPVCLGITSSFSWLNLYMWPRSFLSWMCSHVLLSSSSWEGCNWHTGLLTCTHLHQHPTLVNLLSKIRYDPLAWNWHVV